MSAPLDESTRAKANLVWFLLGASIAFAVGSSLMQLMRAAATMGEPDAIAAASADLTTYGIWLLAIAILALCVGRVRTYLAEAKVRAVNAGSV